MRVGADGVESGSLNFGRLTRMQGRGLDRPASTRKQKNSKPLAQIGIPSHALPRRIFELSALKQTNMNTNRRKASWILTTGLGIALLAPLTRAQIVTYPIALTSGNSPSLSATGVGSHITASDLTLVGMSRVAFTQSFSGSSWPLGTFDSGKYFQFSVTPEAGYAVTYSTLTYSLFRTVLATTDVKTWELRASLDGFASSNIQLASNSLEGVGSLTMARFINNISALGTQSGQVTFRLFGQDNGNTGNGLAGLVNRTEFAGTGSDVLLGGSISAVPEAEQIGMIAAGSLLAFGYLRRRR